MNKLITTLFIVLVGTNLNYAQVGIGTETPEAMLDVAGTLQVRDSTLLQAPLKLGYIEDLEVTELSGDEIVLIADLGDQNIVKRVSLETLAEGLDVPDENTVNTTLYKVRGSSGFSLLNIGLFNSWQKIIFPTNAPHFGNSALVDSNGVYTVPSDGIYAINVYFRYGTGVQLSLLGGTPQVGIIRRASGTTNDTLLDSRAFTGLNLVVASLTFTEADINTIYQFNAGDKIYFAVNTGGVTLGLLSTSAASFNIHKISGKP